MYDFLLSACAAARTWRVAIGARLRLDDRGEGVISTAIAVLIMAFLGALMWVSFNAIWESASRNTAHQVSSIGR